MEYGWVQMMFGAGNGWQEFRNQGAPGAKALVLGAVVTGPWQWEAVKDREESRNTAA